MTENGAKHNRAQTGLATVTGGVDTQHVILWLATLVLVMQKMSTCMIYITLTLTLLNCAAF